MQGRFRNTILVISCLENIMKLYNIEIAFTRNEMVDGNYTKYTVHKAEIKVIFIFVNINK